MDGSVVYDDTYTNKIIIKVTISCTSEVWH